MNRRVAMVALATLISMMAADGKARTMTNLLFLHHSCGGQLLADPGPEVEAAPGSAAACIYTSHANGGGLRTALTQAGFQVHEASYGSVVGEDTDICHWNRKFRDRMDVILRTDRQDELLPDGQTNDVVVFKSCYPNNEFSAAGVEPGDPDACERTVANAKAAYRALLPYFARHPDVLFVAMTAPPLAEPRPIGLKARLKSLLRSKPRADLAREFNAWLVDGWLAGEHPSNVVVFDYFGFLTDQGASGWSAYPTKDGRDSHPSSAGNRRAAEAFVAFLDQAWRAHQANLSP
jgi:hypothetical protein